MTIYQLEIYEEEDHVIIIKQLDKEIYLSKEEVQLVIDELEKLKK